MSVYTEITLDQRLSTHCYAVYTVTPRRDGSGMDIKGQADFVTREDAWATVKRLRDDLAGTNTCIYVEKDGVGTVHEEYAA